MPGCGKVSLAGAGEGLRGGRLQVLLSLSLLSPHLSGPSVPWLAALTVTGPVHYSLF